MSELSIDGKISGSPPSHTTHENDNDQSKDELISSDSWRHHLKEVFDYCSVGKPDSLGFFEFCEALKHLDIKLTELKISQAFWKQIENSGDLTRKEINFDEFCALCQELKEFQHQNKKFSIDYNVMAFKGDGNFVMMQGKELKYVETQPEDDLINLFMKRIEKGYGLYPEINIKVLEDLENANRNKDWYRKGRGERRANLKDFWEFIHKCQLYKKEKESNAPKLLVDPVNGINSFINLHQEENRSNALRIFDHYVLENDERAKGLQICGWTELKCFEENDQLNRICSKLEESNQGFRAIAIAIFHFDFILAFQILFRLLDRKNEKNQRILAENVNELSFLKEILIGLNNIHILLKHNPELKRMFVKPDKEWSEGNSNFSNLEAPSQEQMDQIMKFNLLEINENMLTELYHQKNTLGKFHLINHTLVFLKNLCKNAEFNHPFLHSICKFISFENFGQSNYILEDVEISFFDRIGFALRFLNTKTLNQFIDNYLTLGENDGLLEIMIITGKCEKSLNFLRTYLDKYNDIQTVGLASILLRFLKFPEENRLMHWFRGYKEILNRLQLWDTRILLDKNFQEIELVLTERGKSPANLRGYFAEENNNNVTEKLGFCACSLSHENTSQSIRKESQIPGLSAEKTRIFDCIKCLKPASNCAICLLPVTVPNTYLEQDKNKKSSKKQLESLSEILNFEEAMIWCQKSKHGGHYSHMMEWFQEFTTCAVTDCPCECSLL